MTMKYQDEILNRDNLETTNDVDEQKVIGLNQFIS
jgi:hypothetical protein